MSPAPLIYINAFPGTGKLTIATHLLTLLGSANALLIDNHQLIDPVEARIPRTHPEYQAQRKLVRAAAFERYVEGVEGRRKCVVFTDFQSDDALGSSVAMEFLAAAQGSGRLFLPVCLTCEVEENVRRVDSAERVGSRTTKLVDPQLLREFRAKSKLFHFEGVEGLKVDVTKREPLEAARVIVEFTRWKFPAAIPVH